MKEKILDNFIPFELEVDNFGLYEIYPAKLIKQFKSIIDDKDYEEACSALEEYNISEDAIKIICVSTFDDMLNALKEMGD